MHRPNIEEQEKCAGLILIFYDIIGPVRFFTLNITQSDFNNIIEYQN